MDGWCGFIIFLDRVGLGIGGRMGEFDRFYVYAKLRREERVFINEEYLFMQVHQIPYPYFPVVVFLQSVSQNPYQSNIYIYP